jgi:hypothetical protein
MTSDAIASPIRAERRAGLIRAIARSQQWLEEIVSGRSTIEQIAVRQKCSVRQVNLTLSMAFLAPSLIKAAIEGRLSRGIGIAALRDAPLEWSKQYIKLGLPRFCYDRRNGGYVSQSRHFSRASVRRWDLRDNPATSS